MERWRRATFVVVEAFGLLLSAATAPHSSDACALLGTRDTAGIPENTKFHLRLCLRLEIFT